MSTPELEAAAEAEADPGLGSLTGAPGEPGLEVLVCTQVPLGAFQCTGTGPSSGPVMPATTAAHTMSTCHVESACTN